MEEDIKILEKLISIYQELKQDFEEGHESSYEMQFEDFKALENLIKGYRELEKHISFYEKHGSYKERIIELKEENESLVRQYEYQGALMVNEYFSKEQVFELFIPKSKIKEKIEELKEKGESDLRTYGFAVETHLALQTLQEIMEDK